MTGIQASDIESLLELFQSSDWASLHLRIGDTALYLDRNGQAPGIGGGQASAASTAAPPTPATTMERSSASAPVASASASAAKTRSDDAVPEGMVTVKAPNLGTFYRAPKPGAPAYVEIGQRVEADTEVCLIEVMKLFTPVVAGITGVVRKILVNDADMVEYDQALFHIERED